MAPPSSQIQGYQERLRDVIQLYFYSTLRVGSTEESVRMTRISAVSANVAPVSRLIEMQSKEHEGFVITAAGDSSVYAGEMIDAVVEEELLFIT